MPRHDHGFAFLAPLADIEACVEWLRSSALHLPAFAQFLLPEYSGRWPDSTVRAMTFVRKGFRLRPGSKATVHRFDFAKAALDLEENTLVMVDFLPFTKVDGVTDAAPWGVRLQRTFEDDELRGEMSCNSKYFAAPDFADAARLIDSLAPSARIGSF
jgi:hypothetical protein